MTSRDEALRALEKAVELVAKATRGPWAFINERHDDCLLAFGTETLDHDVPPPWYSCWTSINPDDGRALIAAANFIREHGSALLAELGQEVEAVAYIVPVARVTSDGSYEDGPPQLCFADEADDYVRRVGAPLYTSPAHTSEARDAYITDLLIRIQQHLGVGCVAQNGYRSAHNRLAVEIETTLRNAEDAAMRQEAGSRD